MQVASMFGSVRDLELFNEDVEVFERLCVFLFGECSVACIGVCNRVFVMIMGGDVVYNFVYVHESLMYGCVEVFVFHDVSRLLQRFQYGCIRGLDVFCCADISVCLWLNTAVL